MKIYLNDEEGKRKVVEATLVEDRLTTILVKLPDGNIIKRNKKRDLVKEN